MDDQPTRKTISLHLGQLKDTDVAKMATDTLDITEVSPIHLYKGRNLISALGHYGASVGLAGAAFMIANPWAIGAAVLLVGGINYLAVKAQKRFLENNLEVQPNTSDISPHLGEIAAELYKKSGLKAEGNPIYDFKSDEAKVKKSESFWNELLAKMQDMAAKTHNAAALQMGKPVIMISKPLLKLLDDKEEKGVLAHEFAHAAARHQYLTMPAGIITGIATTAVGLTLAGALFTLGWTPFLLSLIAGIAAKSAFKKILPAKEREIMGTTDKELSFPDIAKKKKLTGLQNAFSTVVNTSVIWKYNPAYVILYATYKATKTVSTIITKGFSRSIEYQADRGAVTYGADPLALATGLRKIEIVVARSTEAAYEGQPVPKKGFLKKAWANLNADHPTTENRVKRLCKMAEKQGVAQDLIDKAAKGEIEVSKDNDMPPSLLKSLACGGDALRCH